MARLFDDASSEYLVNIGSPPLAAYPITMAGWFYTDINTASETILSIGDQSQQDRIDLSAAGHIGGDPIYIWTENAAAGSGVGSTSGFSLNTWHHACGSVTAGGTMSAYIDGGNKGTVGGAKAWGGAFDYTAIGATRYVAPLGYFSGRLAECAIWNVVLTDAEVTVLATGIRPIMVCPQNIVAYWPLVRDQDYDLVGSYAMTPFNSPTIAAHAPVIYGATPGLFGEGGGDGPTNLYPGLSGLSAMTGLSPIMGDGTGG